MDTPAAPLVSWMLGPSEQIAEQRKDNMHCEEQLRTTLHCDDKEKLRRKLALLQREYLRTAERLQRAERLDAVRRHVGSRISQQDHQNQRDPEVPSNPCPHPSSLILNTTKGTAPSVAQCQRHTGGPANSESSNAACPQTPDPSHDTAKGHRSTPALRLRSQRSRLRWERRSAGRSTEDNREEGRSQSERMETVRTEGSGERVKMEGTEVVNESEELFSGTDSESPSLLLTHWNSSGQTETGDIAGKEIQGRQREKETELRAEGKIESESTSLLLTCWNPAIHTEGTEQDVTQNGRNKETEEGEENRNTRGQRDVRLCEDSSNKDTEKNAAEEIESEKNHDNTAEIKEEKRELIEGEHDVKGVGLLDSCTLVEGLLFPAEYYVRTTRRMTFSQSQPDMQAVILSQLSVGRHRRGRGLNRRTRLNDAERSGQHTGTGLSSPATAPVDPRMESQSADTSAELNSQSSSEISDQISASRHQVDIDSCLSPTVTTARPARGRRKRRGRGRGRPQTPRCSVDTHRLGLGQTSHNPQPTSSPLSSFSSLRAADGPKPRLTLGEAVPMQDDPQSVSILSTATQPSSGVDGAQVSSASGHLVKVFPIFLKSSDATNGSTQTSRSAASLQSLLLPSSSPAQTSLFPLPCLSPGPLVNKLMNFDIMQDFHLPDDQFASLKLHKLRQVAVDSGVEYFTSPSHNSRRSNRRSDTQSSSDTMMPLPLSLSLTPTIANSPHPTEPKQAATRPVDFQNLSIEHKHEDKLTSQSITEGSAEQDIMKIPGEQQTENLYPDCQTRTTSTESVSVVQDCAADCVDQYVEQNTAILNTHSQSSVSASNTHRTVDHPVNPQPHINFADRPAGKVNDYVIGRSDEHQIKESFVISSEEQTVCPGVVHPLEDQRSTNHHTENKAIIETLSLDCPIQKTPEEPSNSCTAVQFCKNSEAPGESPVPHLNAAKDSDETTTSPPRDRLVENKNPDSTRVHAQLLLSPPLASEPCPFITPHLPSSAPPYSPTLPSLGLTPHPPLTSSPTAPPLTLAPRLSPSTQALSPPALCPCPSLLSSQPTTSPAGQIQASSVPLCADDQRVEPPTTVSSIQPQGSSGQVGLRTEETAEEHMMRCTHTLKAPAGGYLVDACCLPGSSGHLCVVAAGKWAVCLWSQTSASDWSLTHTWAFNEPVINVFPVPDAAGLICVTLGQLEIREVRMLSCSSLLQVLLCEGVVQTVVGVSKSRVVTSSHSASGSTLQVFTLSDSGSTQNSQTLLCPGVCVGALAPVDGLSDALIGTDEGGNLFVWNLKTGQQLRRIILGDGLSHTSCLRGYSYSGVLFVLLQHQLLSSLEEEAKDQMCSKEERKKTALFSLVAVNPLSGKSALATRLHPPKAWSGRLCEADVHSSSVVGLSQSGCVCVWDLGQRATSRMVWAPESEGWQLARWGGGGTLVTGHHNGDVTLHCYSTSQASLCHQH
ncbi:partner and localizer of BRCA2 [Sander lucioperca]|uniref:partner and localizer of BRCA2 n=1 Tax=Sander lucioperca TaxID=283035 RepID=UPI001653B224|nr:partner and localizer of BRCA2 [Sander lucioperca]